MRQTLFERARSLCLEARHRLRLARRALFPGRIRHYGDDGTIHRTGEVNVEVDRSGKVVAVWFRCAVLPFTQDVANEERARGLRRIYERPPRQITAIDFVDPE